MSCFCFVFDWRACLVMGWGWVAALIGGERERERKRERDAVLVVCGKDVQYTSGLEMFG